jgi:hypothetical protein
METHTEVLEPDLSMELSGQLQQSLADLEEDCSDEVRALQMSARADVPAEELAEQVEHIWMKYAHTAVADIVFTLRSFNPEISQERLSLDVHSIIHSDAIVGHLGKPMIVALRDYVPRERSEWLGRDIERHLAAKRASLRLLWQKVLSTLRAHAEVFTKERSTRMVLLSAGGTSVVCGTAGGALGLFSGAIAGAVAGCVPAFVTFGLSIPVGLVSGGTIGALGGMTAGSFTGLLGGGAACGAIAYHEELIDSMQRVKVITNDGVQHAVKVFSLAADGALAVAKDEKLQTAVVTAAGAASSAAVAGVGGGAFGLVAGSAVGTACGLVPAPFTFGLSIPVGAAVGGSTGLILGAASAATLGLVTGSLCSHGVYVRRAEISSSVIETWSKVQNLADSVKQRANYSASYVKDRLVGGTGGTA